MGNKPVNRFLALTGRDLRSWVDLISRICNHGSRICNFLDSRRCKRLEFMFGFGFNEWLGARQFQLCNVARQVEMVDVFSWLWKFARASFVGGRLVTLPRLEVELGIESFIHWRCPRSVLSCVGAFIYRAGSLVVGLGEKKRRQRQPLTLELISTLGFSLLSLLWSRLRE